MHSDYTNLGVPDGIENTIKELLDLLEEEGWCVHCQFFQHQHLKTPFQCMLHSGKNVCVCICVGACVHVCVCVCACACMCACMHVCVHVCNVCACVRACVCVCVHVHMSMHVCL